MKLNKILAVAVLGLFVSSTAFGQLMVRDNTDGRVIQGTRPEAGNFGFTIGSGFTEIKEMFDEDIHLRGLPLMNFNYYFTDNIEITLATQIYNKRMKSEGNLLDSAGIEVNNDYEHYVRFMPGVNYHFDQTNFFDTYAGANIILGSEGETREVGERLNKTGDYYSESAKKSSFVWGFDLHFGIRRFIGDLPVAWSLEAGMQGLKRSNTQYEFETKSTVGGVETAQSFLKTEDDSDELKFSDLKQSEFEIGANLRFGVSLFFRQ